MGKPLHVLTAQKIRPFVSASFYANVAAVVYAAEIKSASFFGNNIGFFDLST